MRPSREQTAQARSNWRLPAEPMVAAWTSTGSRDLMGWIWIRAKRGLMVAGRLEFTSNFSRHVVCDDHRNQYHRMRGRPAAVTQDHSREGLGRRRGQRASVFHYLPHNKVEDETHNAYCSAPRPQLGV